MSNSSTYIADTLLCLSAAVPRDYRGPGWTQGCHIYPFLPVLTSSYLYQHHKSHYLDALIDSLWTFLKFWYEPAELSNAVMMCQASILLWPFRRIWKCIFYCHNKRVQKKVIQFDLCMKSDGLYNCNDYIGRRVTLSRWTINSYDYCRRWHYRVSTARPWKMGADRLPWCWHSCLPLYKR